MSRKFLVPVVLPADPVAAMEAATKQYVDSHSSPSEVEIAATDPIGTNAAAELWVDTSTPPTDLALPSGMPRGLVAYAERTTDAGPFSTETAVPALTFSVVLAADRMYRIKNVMRISTTVANDRIATRVYQDGVQVAISDQTAGGSNLVYIAERVLRLQVGTKTFTVTVQRVSGTGTATVTASATVQCFLMIEDIGVAM